MSQCGKFPVPRKPGTCFCCGLVIIESCPTCGNLNHQAENPDYRRLHFRLNNGSVAPISFCTACSHHDWTDSIKLLHVQWAGSLDPTVLGLDDTPAQTWGEVR